MRAHKHCEVIKAWADGAEIQYRANGISEWRDCVDNSPNWTERTEYRVKPEIHYARVSAVDVEYDAARPEYAVIKATTDDGVKHALMVNLITASPAGIFLA